MGRSWLLCWLAGASLVALACSDGDGPAGASDGGDAKVQVGPAPYQSPRLDAAAPEARADTGTSTPDGPLEAGIEAGPEAAISACGRIGPIHTGGAAILDAFPLEQSILVVRKDALVLVGRNGEVQKTLTAPREITAVDLVSATAGPLVVADRAMLVTYSLELVETGSVLLTEECRAATLVEGRLVCGPTGSYGSSFFVYDVSPPRLVAKSGASYSYGGAFLRGVPGTPYIVVGGSLYKLQADGQVKSANAGYYNPTSGFSQIAFFGRPATHLINQAGELYRILGPGCDGPMTSTPPSCLVREGAVGTLPTGRAYSAMNTDAAGTTLLGLMTNGTSYDRITSVTLQRSDVARRVLLGEKQHQLQISAALSLRADPTCDRVVVVTRSGEERPYEPSSRATYTVVQLD